MNIKFQPIKEVVCSGSWRNEPLVFGAIFVENETDIEPLWNLLCQESNTWQDYRHLIQVVPEHLNNISELKNFCHKVGDTVIDDVDKFKSQIDFTIFQYEKKNIIREKDFLTLYK